MNTSDILAYATMLIAMTLAPGPLMAVVIARTIGKDIGGATAFSFGIAAGNVIIVTLVFSGLGIWLTKSPVIFDAIKYGAFGYLLWVAYTMWRASIASDDNATKIRKGSTASALAGMVACFASPHYIVLYLLFLPKLVNLNTVGTPTIALVTIITFTALAATFGGVILIARRFSNTVLSGGTNQILSKTLASVIALSGAWMVVG